jgi:hypothetical protein
MKAKRFIPHYLNLLFFFSLLPYYGISQKVTEGYNKLYYANGKLSSEGTIRDGKPDGYWKTY